MNKSIQCPYCAEPINAAATVCKHCGRDIRRNRNQMMFIIFIVLVIIIIGLVLNYTINLYTG